MSAKSESIMDRRAEAKRARQVYLSQVALYGDLHHAATVAGRTKAWAQKLRERSSEFARKEEQARFEYIGRLNAAAFKVATEGWTETDTHRDSEGNLVRTVERTRFSPLFLREFLAVVYPERWGLKDQRTKPDEQKKLDDLATEIRRRLLASAEELDKLCDESAKPIASTRDVIDVTPEGSGGQAKNKTSKNVKRLPPPEDD